MKTVPTTEPVVEPVGANPAVPQKPKRRNLFDEDEVDEFQQKEDTTTSKRNVDLFDEFEEEKFTDVPTKSKPVVSTADKKSTRLFDEEEDDVSITETVKQLKKVSLFDDDDDLFNDDDFFSNLSKTKLTSKLFEDIEANRDNIFDIKGKEEEKKETLVETTEEINVGNAESINETDNDISKQEIKPIVDNIIKQSLNLFGNDYSDEDDGLFGNEIKFEATKKDDDVAKDDQQTVQESAPSLGEPPNDAFEYLEGMCLIIFLYFLFFTNMTKDSNYVIV